MSSSNRPNLSASSPKSTHFNWISLPNAETLDKTITSLKNNGFEVFKVVNGEEAIKKVLELVPPGSEVLEMQSMTLRKLGLDKLIVESGKFKTPKKALASIQDQSARMNERRKISVVDYTIGSANAITEDGHLIFASTGGSQLASYAYTAKQVILIVGTHKIVKNLDDGMKRISEYVLPLETDRLRTAMNNPSINAGVNKVLLLNREFNNRVKVILVPEILGF